MTAITVARVFAPKEGQKSGSIQSTDGKYYRYNADKHGLYKVGQSFDVAVKETIYEGKPFFWLPKDFVPSGGSEPAPGATPAAAPVPAHNKDVQITAIALMKSYIETGKFGLTDLPMLEQACIPAAKRIVEAS